MSQWVVVYDDELYHHGIKGQKWGIRRWQNEDGSLTPEGVKRYGTVENFEKAQHKKKIAKRVAAGVGAGLAVTGAAVGAGFYLANHKNAANKLDVYGRAVGKVAGDRFRAAQERRKNISGLKRITKNLSYDQASKAYENLNKNYDFLTGSRQDREHKRQLDIKRKVVGAQVRKKAMESALRNLKDMPLVQAKQMGGKQGKQVIENIGLALWSTPIQRFATGVAGAAGAAGAGYVVKKLKDKTRKTSGEEAANYMWQNPNKK